MKKIFLIVVLILIASAGIKLLLSNPNNSETALTPNSDHKNAAYIINGDKIKLENGYAERSSAPNSASVTKTQYFGNELHADLNGDGREDVAFILTEDAGGSGLFYYAVAAVASPEGYIGSDGYLLGDRIAPQSTTLSPDSNQKYVVVFNYADRRVGEPMSTPGSIGKSTYLKLDPETLRWAIVLPPEERESL